MKCPKCHERVAFKSWILWPGPTRECRNCHATLRYVGLYVQAMLHLVIGIPIVIALAVLVESSTISLLLAAVIFLGILAITAVVLPWNFARYEECDRRTGWTKGLLLPAAILVTMVALFYAWTNWSGARELRATLAQLDAKKESIRLEDFIPPSVPDERNVAAAPIFREIFASKNDSRLNKLTLPWKGSVRPFEGKIHLIQIAKEIDPAFSGDEASAGRAVLESLASSEPLLAELREALRRPQVCWPLDYSKGFALVLPQVGPTAKISQMLHVRALAELATGAPEKAFEDTNTLLALAEVSASPHFLINELVQNSILTRTFEVIADGLSRGAWSDSNLATFSESLAQKNLAGQMPDAFRMERAMGQQMDWSDLELLKGIPENNAKRGKWADGLLNMAWHLRPAGWTNRDRALNLLLTQRMIEAMGDGGRISPDEVRSYEARIYDPLRTNWGRLTTPITYYSFPATNGVIQAAALAQTLLESTRTACAVERYRLANKRLPANLTELVPAFLAEVPRDPITGAPLLYKPSPDGSFVLYGVGWNQTDDGGSVNSPEIDRPRKQADWGVSVSRH